MFRYNLRSAENTGVSRIPSPPTSRDNVKLGSRDFSSEPSRKKSKTSVTSFFSLPPGSKGSGIYNYSLRQGSQIRGPNLSLMRPASQIEFESPALRVVKHTINWLPLDCILLLDTTHLSPDNEIRA